MPWTNNRIPRKPRLSVVPKFHWRYRDHFALRPMIPFLGLMLSRHLWRWNRQRVWAKTQIFVPTDNLNNMFFRFLQREKKFVWSVYWQSEKQPTFHDATTGFPAKWRLSTVCRNSILITRHYPDLGSASDWSCHERNQEHYPDLGSECQWYEISAVVAQTSFPGETSGGVQLIF